MEDLGRGLFIGSVGMGGVFVTLALLLLLIMALRQFVPVEASLEVSLEEIPPPTEVVEAENDMEEMAAAAAVGLLLALEDQSQFGPLDSRRDVAQPTAWRMQGREMLMRGREPRR